MNELARAAERYVAELGWNVFPCRYRDKLPVPRDGFKAATTDLARTREWWAENPRYNIGHVPGLAGHIVVDSDSEEAEREAQQLGLLSEPTLVVTTGRGWHRYYEHPGGIIGNRKLRPGSRLDIRADKGFVLMPPSIHPTGRRYRAIGSAREIATLPPIVIELLRTEPRVPTEPVYTEIHANTPRRRHYVRAAIEAEIRELENTAPGGRNNALNSAAYSLSRFIATGEADPDALADLLTAAGRAVGLAESEIQATLRSAFRARSVAV